MTTKRVSTRPVENSGTAEKQNQQKKELRSKSNPREEVFETRIF
jgi:hypothetical protein